MVASIGVISALRFARYSQTKTPLWRANILGGFLGRRMGIYVTLGLVSSALNLQNPPEQIHGLGIVPVSIL